MKKTYTEIMVVCIVFILLLRTCVFAGPVDSPPAVKKVLEYFREQKINFVFTGIPGAAITGSGPGESGLPVTKENLPECLKQAGLVSVKVLGITVLTPKSNRLNITGIRFFKEYVSLPQYSRYIPQNYHLESENVTVNSVCNQVAKLVQPAGIAVVSPRDAMGTMCCRITLKHCGAVRLVNLLKLVCHIYGYEVETRDNALLVVNSAQVNVQDEDISVKGIPFENPGISFEGKVVEGRDLEAGLPEYLFVKGVIETPIYFKVQNDSLRLYTYYMMGNQRVVQYLEPVTTPVFWEKSGEDRFPFTKIAFQGKEMKVRVTRADVP